MNGGCHHEWWLNYSWHAAPCKKRGRSVSMLGEGKDEDEDENDKGDGDDEDDDEGGDDDGMLNRMTSARSKRTLRTTNDDEDDEDDEGQGRLCFAVITSGLPG